MLMGYLAIRSEKNNGVYHYTSDKQLKELNRLYAGSGVSFRVFKEDKEKNQALAWSQNHKEVKSCTSTKEQDPVEAPIIPPSYPSLPTYPSNIEVNMPFPNIQIIFDKFKLNGTPAAAILTSLNTKYIVLFEKLTLPKYWPKIMITGQHLIKNSPDSILSNSMDLIIDHSPVYSIDDLDKKINIASKLWEIPSSKLMSNIASAVYGFLICHQKPTDLQIIEPTKISCCENFILFENLFSSNFMNNLEDDLGLIINESCTTYPIKYININNIIEIFPLSIPLINSSIIKTYSSYIETSTTKRMPIESVIFNNAEITQK